ncbi:MAG: CDP-alcohol phosphatidyltransferase family protein [Candidatus Eisenbacteria bacterium]|nr:CDP-alcohol phosphatidyltransferase family protein [Candidatus Eisenbacteria bacterium]
MADFGIPPAAVTFAGLIISVLSGLSIALGHFVSAAILLIVAGLCDMIDGETARAGNSATPSGAFLDSTVDRYSEIVVLLGALYYYLARSRAAPEAVTALAVFAAITGSLMVSYTRARGEAIGRKCEVGLTERPERMVILILGALFGAGTFRVAIWVLAVLSHVTAMQRIRHVLVGTRS